MFNLSLPEGADISTAREVSPPGTEPASEILDLTRNRGYTYRLITPKVMAAPIRAAREKKAAGDSSL